MPMTDPLLLRMEGITKRFGATPALAGCRFRFALAK